MSIGCEGDAFDPRGMDHLINFVLGGQLTVAYPRVHQLDRSVREKDSYETLGSVRSTDHKDSTRPLIPTSWR